MQHLVTANMLYTQRKYSAALDELEQANALVPDHYTVLHLRGMCKAELEQYADALSDLTGRAHCSHALYSRGMCHLNLGNHETALDDILMLLLYMLSCCPVLRPHNCNEAQNQPGLAFWFCLTILKFSVACYKY